MCNNFTVEESVDSELRVQQFHSRRVCGFKAMCGHASKTAWGSSRFMVKSIV